MNNIKKEIKNIKKQLQNDPKYQRTPCKNCKYKIICVGECEKTI